MEQIMSLVSHYGYAVLFLVFCLGPFGIPVPTEVTLLAAGIMTAHGLLHPLYTLASMAIGMTSAVTVGYGVGRLARRYGFLDRLSRFNGYRKAERFYVKHNGTALSIGYLIPLVRYFVTVLAGINGVPFKRMLFVSYPSAIVWIGTLYGVSCMFGHRIVQIFQ
ncbi:VTT domain-containing protein [Cohnella ginsengisoli]|uniref:VTT domain-containing protein n=1 Tax=Cohnella ginsengisoli TaxID=425004 RepID=A0A9X4KT42_9BACL|nr:VTT domain-containing protein [Cohnella ginsengisoli]MDG0795075.1 VTT domain-containing protein [Cohnella ginsengisoli]